MPSDGDNETAVALTDPLVGSIFDKRFRVEERIAAGGFGAIYRVTHVKSNHRIALKVLHPTLASDLGVLARFRREGTTLTSLRNPHTITAYEFGQADRILFIVLELLHGETLYDRYCEHGPFEWKRVVHIARQVCESLEEAHAQGIVHRDLKPTNIHLENVDGDPDYVKVLDFGIAKILGSSDQDSSDITNVGQMIGTLDYMSPEQMVGGQVTGQTDVYTLGIVMYELIAGTRPFPESTTAGAALAAMLKTTPEPLYLRAPVPRPLDEIVMRCLERETTRRYRSVGDLRADLEALVADTATGNTATIMLQSSRHAALPEDDETAITPPPEKTLQSLKTAPRPRMLREALLDTVPRDVPHDKAPVNWEDDDEHAPTASRAPDGSDGSAPSLLRPAPRGLASRFDAPSVPQLVVAPFSPRVRPATGQLPHDARAVALGVAPTTILPPVGAQQLGNAPGKPEGTASAASAPPLYGRQATTMGTPGSPASAPYAQSAVPQPLQGSPQSGGVPNPLGHRDPSRPHLSDRHRPPTLPPGAASYLTTSPGHAPAPSQFPPTPSPHALPATPIPSFIPPTPPVGQLPGRIPAAHYDMGNMAARDAAVRRLVWIIVLILGAGAGFVLATQL